VKYPKNKVISARRLRAEGKRLSEIAAVLGISIPTTSQWTRGVLPLNKQAAGSRKLEVLPVLERMYLDGIPIPEISKATGIPQGTLFDWRRELGLPKNKRTTYVTDELRGRISKKLSRDPDGAKKQEALRLYVDELASTLEIGERLGLSAATIGVWLKAMGVPIRKVVTLRTRQKLKVASTGEKRWNWKGGITKEYVRLRTNLEMKLAREACFARDDYTCRCCKQRGGKLNAHHVWPFQRFPQWKYEVWNLMTLCKTCHDKFHNAAGGAVHVAIGPFFSDNGQVREQPAFYEVRIAA
jgi:5-methylcytosine-specific restriction endonuclease McrA/transposase-like protein